MWLNFELIREFMVVFGTCNNEKDPNKNEGPSVATSESE